MLAAGARPACCLVIPHSLDAALICCAVGAISTAGSWFSDASLLAHCELDDALGLSTMAANILAGARTGRNRQSEFGVSRDTRTATAPSACGMMPRCAGCVVFIHQEREFLELNFIIQRIFCAFSKVCGLAFNIFLAHVSQLYHIVSEDT